MMGLCKACEQFRDTGDDGFCNRCRPKEPVKYERIPRTFSISSMSLDDGCFYCGGCADTWDHIVPRKLHGNDSITNLVPACRSCNSAKGKKTLSEYRRCVYADKKFGIKVHEFLTPDPHIVRVTEVFDGLHTRYETDDPNVVIEGDWQIWSRIYTPWGRKKDIEE